MKDIQGKVTKLSGFLMVIVAVISMTSYYFGSIHYFSDLFSHFQLQYLLAFLALLSVYSSVTQYKVRGVILSTPYFLFALLIIVPAGFISYSVSTDDEPPEIIFINSNYHIKEQDEIAQYIVSSGAQSVVLVEANPQIVSLVGEHYGDPISNHGERAFTCAIYSRNPQYQEVSLDRELHTYPICAVSDGSTLIISTHPFPPVSAETYLKQINHFTEVREVYDSSDESHKIILGDFNSTSYSRVFRESFRDIFEVNQYSWRANSPLAIPIDHALSSSEITVEMTPILNSDHRGLLVWVD